MKALLALEDGFVLEGESFTGPIELAGGEVIFNTAMTGYQELITDPSYPGQRVCMTGDPATLTAERAIITALADRYPVAGICLGHQLLALALGGRTEKLKFGHHGVNHPVKNLISGKVEISSQNHGFHVIAEGDIIPTHVNLNDGTLEGFRHKTKPIITVQHHPEAASGPTDCQSFFGSFRELLTAKRK